MPYVSSNLRNELSGGKMIIKAPKYGKIEIGIPNMYYKDKLIDSLTRLKALTTRQKQKSVILEETDNKDIVIEDDGEEFKDGVKFHTLKIKVPKSLINIKKLKSGDKEVEVPTLTNKSKNLTMRNKIRSIKFKTIEGNKVKILDNADNVEIHVPTQEPQPAPQPAPKPPRTIKPKPKPVEPKPVEPEPIPIPEPKPVKKGKFSYNKEFFDKVDRILSGDRVNYSKGKDSKENVELFNTIVGLQEFDFYQTPDSCIQVILDNMKRIARFTENYFEPSFGFGNFTRKLIDNQEIFTNLETIDGLEFLDTTYELIKDNINITDLYKGDFLDFFNDKYYDTIFINPPYTGRVQVKEKYVNEGFYWAYFIVKCILLQSKGERQIYTVLPVDTSKLKPNQAIDSYFLFQNIPKTVKDRIIQVLNLKLTWEDIEDNILQLQYLGSCNEFYKLNKGKVVKMGLHTGMFCLITGKTENKENFKSVKKQEPEEEPEPANIEPIIPPMKPQPEEIKPDSQPAPVNSMKPEEITPPVPIKDPKTEFEEEINKMIKFSLGHVNFDEFSQELINPSVYGVSPTSGIISEKQNILTYYLALKYKISLIYSGTQINANDGYIGNVPSVANFINMSLDNDFTLNTFNMLDLRRGVFADRPLWFLNPDTLEVGTVGSFMTKEKKNSYTQQYLFDNIKNILDKSNKQVALQTTIGTKSSGLHAIVALFRPFEKKVYVMDPHGTQGVSDFKATYQDQNRYFTQLANHIGYEYITSDASCPYVVRDKRRGFQSIENMLGKKMGFCGYWSLFLMELALQHPTMPMTDVYKKAGDIFTDNPDKVFRTIVKYQANVSMIINEIAKEEGINISDFFKMKTTNIPINKKSQLTELNVMNSSFQKFCKIVSNNITKIYFLQKTKLGYGESNIGNFFYHEDLTGEPNVDSSNFSLKGGDFFDDDWEKEIEGEDLIGAGLSGGDFFDDEDWSKITDEMEGGDIDWWGIAKDIGSDLYTEISKLGETEEQKEARIKKEEACKLCNEGKEGSGIGANSGFYRTDPKRFTGGAVPTNKKLYEKAKEIVYPQYKKPSAYRSGAVIKKYKELGGRFKDDGERKLRTWFKEEWKDIGNNEYPVFRPTKRITKNTPLTPDEIDPANLKLQIKEKQKIKGEKNLKPFVKKGGSVLYTPIYAKDKYVTGEKQLTTTEKAKVKREFGEGNPEIQEIQREPMGDDDIRKYFPKAKIIKYSELSKYNDITQLLPKNKSFFFLLYEREPNVGHWVLVCRYKDNGIDTIEFFCSYGSKIDGPLTWTPIGIRVQLGEDKPYLSMLLDKSPFRVVYNSVQYQSKKSQIATCGAYNVLRASELQKHDTTLEEFTEMLEEVKKATGLSYDELVSNLVKLR